MSTYKSGRGVTDFAFGDKSPFIWSPVKATKFGFSESRMYSRNFNDAVSASHAILCASDTTSRHSMAPVERCRSTVSNYQDEMYQQLEALYMVLYPQFSVEDILVRLASQYETIN